MIRDFHRYRILNADGSERMTIETTDFANIALNTPAGCTAEQIPDDASSETPFTTGE